MRKHTLHLVVACIAIALLQAAECGAEGVSGRPDEYELMSLLIREQYGSEFSLILIGRDTESWCLGEGLGFLHRQWPQLKGETIDSLIVNNRGAVHRLARRFRLPVEYRLLSDQEYLEVLGGNTDDGTFAAGADAAVSGMEVYEALRDAVEPDWDNFDRVFPDVQGYLTFSRVAFDSECTQALVIFSNSYRCSGVRVRPRKREIACFMKRDGAWELIGVSRGIDAMD